MSSSRMRKPKRPAFNTTLILISTAAIFVGLLAGIVAVFFGLPIPSALAQDTTLPVESQSKPMRFTHLLNIGAELSYALLDAAPARHPKTSGATGAVG